MHDEKEFTQSFDWGIWKRLKPFNCLQCFYTYLCYIKILYSFICHRLTTCGIFYTKNQKSERSSSHEFD